MTEPRLVKRMRLVVVALLACGLFPSSAFAWYNPAWAYRQEITILPTLADSNLSGFPYLVKITDGANPVFANALANGDDIVFTSSDGSTKLAHELEKYDSTTNELYAWVRVPSISSTVDTVIYMYYGNGSVTASEENVEGTWDNDFVDVQHLQETAGTHFDSTSNNNDGSPLNGVNQNATGQIDGANQFDGSNDKVDAADSASLRVVDMTVEAWVYVPNSIPAGFDGIVVHAPSTSNWYGLWKNSNRFHFRWSTGSVRRTDFNATFSPNQWYYVAGVLDVAADRVYTYQNDNLDRTINGPSAPTPTAGPLYIGHAFSGSEFFPGIIDEVRISRIARSDAWIKASARNQGTPDTYQNLGPEESDSCVITTTVDSLTPGSLRACIISANTNPGADTITIPAGTYALNRGNGDDNANNGDLDITDALTLNGAGAGSTIINGNSLDRVFHLLGGNTATLSDLTIQGGNGNDGGGIRNQGTLTLNDVTLTNNTSNNGGGIRNQGTLTLNDVTLANNNASANGGGIHNEGGAVSVTATNVTFSGNTATDKGSGLYLRDAATTTLTDVTFTSNTGANEGGGMFIEKSPVNFTGGAMTGNSASNRGGAIRIKEATINLTEITLDGNSASSTGGGIYSEKGNLTILRTTLSGNFSAAGGGIYVKDGSPTLTNVTLSGNSATNTGGGIDHANDTLTLNNVTFSGNSAGGSGGGIRRVAGTVNLQNTIVANSPVGGDCSGTVVDGGNNLDSDGTCAVTLTAPPLLGPLANNGGPTLTHALGSGSAAIDTGNNIGCPATDQRGAARPTDGDGSGSEDCDIGAYEAPAVLALPTITLSKSADVATAKPADTITYTLTYGNSGAGDATNLVITDTIPANTTLIPASITGGGTESGGVITWNLGPLAAGQVNRTADFAVTVDAGVLAGVVIDNNATANFDDSGGAPQTPVTSDTLNVTVDQVGGVSVQPDQSGTVRSATGNQLSYTFTVTNTGNGNDHFDLGILKSGPDFWIGELYDATGTVLMAQDADADGTWDFVNPAVDFDADGQPDTGTMAAGATLDVILRLTVPAGTTPGDRDITSLTATSNFDDGFGLATATSVAVSGADTPEISFTKSDSPDPVLSNDTLSYAFTYENTGTRLATGVVMVDSIPAGAAFVSSSAFGESGVAIEFSTNNRATWGAEPADPTTVTDIRWTVGKLNKSHGAQVAGFDVQPDVALPDGSILVNSATLSSNELPDITVTASTTVRSAVAFTNSTKTVAPTLTSPGATLLYTIFVTNSGAAAGTNVVVTDLLPLETSYVPGSITGAGADDSGAPTLTWNLGVIPAGTTIGPLTYQVIVNNPVAANTFFIENIASIDSNETLPANTTTATTVLTAAPLFSGSTKTSQDLNAGPLLVGDTIEYRVAVINTGDMNASGVVVTDTVPADTAYVPGSITGLGADDSAAPNLTWNIGNLAVGVPSVVTFRATVNGGVPIGTQISNLAQIASDQTAAVSTPPVVNTVGGGTTGSIQSTSPIVPGANVLIRITDADLNTNIATLQSFSETTTNTVTGETELLMYTETGPNTGTFEVTVLTVFGIAAGTNDDGVFNVQAGDTLETTYNDALTSSGTPGSATATTVVTGGGSTGTLVSTTPINPGDIVTLTLTDADLDVDPGVAETTSVTTVNSVTGESETLLYTETGVNTAVFSANVATVFGIVAGTDNDGTFNVQAGDSLVSIYSDALTVSGGPGVAVATTDVLSAGVSGTISSTATISPFDAVTFTLTDADLDTDPGVAETVILTTTNSVTGESEALLYTETGVNTGLFTASVATVLGAVAGTDDDGTFNVQVGDSLATTYIDAISDTGGPASDIATTNVVLGSAELTVLKSVVTVRDPLGAVAPAALAIPDGTVEYEVSVTNSGNANATEVIVTDALHADLSFLAGDFDGGAADVEIIVGAAAPVYCIAEVGGDTNTDGCFLNAAGDELTVTIPVSGSHPTGLTIGTTAPDNVVVVHFRATVN